MAKALLAALLLAPGISMADPGARPMNVRAAEFQEKLVAPVRQAVNDGASDLSVRKSGDNLGDMLNQVTPAIELDTTGRPLGDWQHPVVSGEEAPAEVMLAEMRKGFRSNKHVPPPDVDAALSRAEAMHGKGSVTVKALDAKVMGLYNWVKGHFNDGYIALNSSLVHDISRLVGAQLASLTLLHEAQHSGNHDLESKETVAGEVDAFATQYKGLVLYDPYGERVATLIGILNIAAKRYPDNSLVADSLAYVKTLNRLRGTEGDRKKLEDFVYELGYRNGENAAPTQAPSA